LKHVKHTPSNASQVAHWVDTYLQTPFESKKALSAHLIQTLSFHTAQRSLAAGMNGLGS